MMGAEIKPKREEPEMDKRAVYIFKPAEEKDWLILK